MTSVDGGIDLLLLVIVSLLPALVYLAWVRRSARFQRESWGPLIGAFLYGALFATVAAALVEVVLVAAGTAASMQYPAPEFTFLNGNSTLGGIFLVLVIAPFVEEALKASGVYSYRDRFRSIADGPVFGASVGLGFGFFETFLYGLGAYLVGGLAVGIALILVRSLSSVLLHGSSTGMFGYGFARSQFRSARPRHRVVLPARRRDARRVQRPRVPLGDPGPARGVGRRRRHGVLPGPVRRGVLRVRGDRARAIGHRDRGLPRDPARLVPVPTARGKGSGPAAPVVLGFLRGGAPSRCHSDSPIDR